MSVRTLSYTMLIYEDWKKKFNSNEMILGFSL